MRDDGGEKLVHHVACGAVLLAGWLAVKADGNWERGEYRAAAPCACIRLSDWVFWRCTGGLVSPIPVRRGGDVPVLEAGHSGVHDCDFIQILLRVVSHHVHDHPRSSTYIPRSPAGHSPSSSASSDTNSKKSS